MYICDLGIMDGVPCREGTYCTAPLCLLHVNTAGQLKPIAIQLSQTQEDNPIFLPVVVNDCNYATLHCYSLFSVLMSPL